MKPACLTNALLLAMFLPGIAQHNEKGVSLRTNLAYDVFLMPTLGAEWRINSKYAAKLDLSFSSWGDKNGKIQHIFIASPEFRWYQQKVEGLYLGAGLNFGTVDLYKGMVGNLISKNTGYKGSFWNFGITGGYQLSLSRALAIDFNLGLGYTRFSYDTFLVNNETRVDSKKDITKNFFGPTQGGISLVWRL